MHIGFDVEAGVQSLLAHARALVGVELGDLADQLGLPVPVGAVQTKGWSGQIIERELGVESGGVRGPDFAALGVELKTVPVDVERVPQESTAVCHIDPIAIAGDSWETSYVREKLRRVLFVALEVPPGSVSVGERRVVAAGLWSPGPAEEEILRNDFMLFVRAYFRRGRADEITGHLGTALQVRPKGRNAADMRDGYDAAGRPTRVGKSGFYLRPSFVAAILRRL
ncbi:MAG TPA: MutH/Sau3AI family endonuclease [Polyangia bacterium]|nr:MutH/Sau3AI family endonuclease [Polyangia bacterium]